uniref:V-type proton ATPase subunit a n=1 Tax=Chromera velia CCMP2878 TaxID=1169474 RepID=A0A0G4HRV1_9ALVE|eukprot:Cvel_30782.t1-p1 / transcript=Cvel_30782.t1 / gene=Cvel_30782 / organism=Chromera_velia_CCMP2878 / gene_product=hypothetical protein / transcript_product=hypothetical protein / location=Cvel_scaffold4450:5683-8083(+) / protein_length=176 / sequence_SO=supercontig / SO=protein_coding / is_pseudo=false
MGYLRSQSMSRGTLVLPAESDLAKSFVDDLGRHTNLQILDMNETSLLRPFRRSIQRVEEIERQLRYLQDQVTRWRGQIQKGEVGEFLLNDEDYSVDKIETSVKSLYRKFSESDQMNEEMTREIDLAAEEIAVLELAMVVLSGTAGPGLRQRSMSLQVGGGMREGGREGGIVRGNGE